MRKRLHQFTQEKEMLGRAGIAALVLIGLLAGCSTQPEVVMVTATPAPTAAPAGPTTVTVCASGCDFETIQTAVDDAGTSAGSAIEVSEAVHTEAGITLDKDITILGQGAEETIIQAHTDAEQATDRVFVVAEGATVVMYGITVQHGNRIQLGEDASWGGDEVGGGGILNLGTLTLESCIVRDNSARHGGGILNRGTLRAVDSSFIANTAHGSPMPGQSCGAGGGIKHNGPSMELVNCTLSGNTAATNGGGVFLGSGAAAALDNALVADNHAGTTGSGVYVEGGSARLRHEPLPHAVISRFHSKTPLKASRAISVQRSGIEGVVTPVSPSSRM